MKINEELSLFHRNKLQNDCHSRVEAVPKQSGTGVQLKVYYLFAYARMTNGYHTIVQ
jgi:hypothetical protein